MTAQQLADKIESFGSTDDARAYIESLKLSSYQLTELSRLIDVPVGKKAEMIETILDNLVGYRTRSAAIRA